MSLKSTLYGLLSPSAISARKVSGIACPRTRKRSAQQKTRQDSITARFSANADEIVAELPKLTGPELQQIAEKAEFLAGLEEGLRQIEEGKLIAHEEVKAQFKS